MEWHHSAAMGKKSSLLDSTHYQDTMQGSQVVQVMIYAHHDYYGDRYLDSHFNQYVQN